MQRKSADNSWLTKLDMYCKLTFSLTFLFHLRFGISVSKGNVIQLLLRNGVEWRAVLVFLGVVLTCFHTLKILYRQSRILRNWNFSPYVHETEDEDVNVRERWGIYLPCLLRYAPQSGSAYNIFMK